MVETVGGGGVGGRHSDTKASQEVGNLAVYKYLARHSDAISSASDPRRQVAPVFLRSPSPIVQSAATSFPIVIIKTFPISSPSNE